MRLRIQLFAVMVAFGGAILATVLVVTHRFTLEDGSELGQLSAIALSFSIVGGISYLLAATFCRRIEHLAEQAKEPALHHAAGRVAGTGKHDEITELAATITHLREELTKGEENRSRLVADVAHELRTPVAILRGHLETILSGAMDLDREHLIPLLDETKRMSRLLQDMQDLNLAEAGRLTLERSWVQLGQSLTEIASILEVEAEAKKIHLHVEGSSDGEVYCDASRIKQVWINLIGNAIRYTPEGGRIEILYEVKDGRSKVFVRDNGPGIPHESIPYLFKRFYRGEPSRNRASGGTGLGLAIAKQFVDLHGGALTVDSELGRGTTFTVELPVYPLVP